MHLGLIDGTIGTWSGFGRLAAQEIVLRSGFLPERPSPTILSFLAENFLGSEHVRYRLHSIDV